MALPGPLKKIKKIGPGPGPAWAQGPWAPGPWAHESMGQWAHGSRANGPWAHEPLSGPFIWGCLAP